MLDGFQNEDFAILNTGYNTVFKPGKLSIGLTVPIEANAMDPVPSMTRHIERVQLAEELGFAAVWLRDVPFNVPSFGDAGQQFDPFVYLGALATSTQRIALGTASIILPLRHPAHVAKSAASVDVLSGGRLIMGVASGDRPEEYPAMNMSFPDRGERFRESYDYIRAMAQNAPVISNGQGSVRGNMDMLPKPSAGAVPMLITGGSQQSPDWVAEHADGWMTYPRDVATQAQLIGSYRERIQAAGLQNKPVMQSLYVDVLADPDAPGRPIHLGFQSGIPFLQRYLEKIRAAGVNHVALNLRFNTADVETTLKALADDLLPAFSE